jgi:hypothetical protein
MNENMKFLEAHRAWLELFNQPLLTMRQELVGLIHDDKTWD